MLPPDMWSSSRPGAGDHDLSTPPKSPHLGVLSNTPINRDAADSSISAQIHSGLVNLFGQLPGGSQDESPDPPHAA